MSVQVASLFGTLKLHDEDWKRGIREAEQDSRDFSTRIQDAGRSVRNFGVGMTVATAPITAFGATGLKVASDFQTTFSDISARSKIYGEDLDMLKEAAIQWGADSVFSAQQSAEALLQLTTAGNSATDSVTMMNSVLVGAAASGTDLGFTADKITNILAGMNLIAADAELVIDDLSRASGSVGGTMAELMIAMERGGAKAATYNMQFEDIIPTLAIFSDAGIRGAEAGNALGSMLGNMRRDTKATQKAWADLGTSMYSANGEMRPMGDIINDINAGLDGMTDEERSRALFNLAGQEGMVALNALLASDGIESMKNKMAEATSAQELADAKMGTFAMTMDSLGGSIEALQITALTPLMEDVLQPLVDDYLIPAVNSFRDWAKANPELTNLIVLLGGALVVLGPVLAAVGVGIMGIGAVIGVVMSPIGLLIGAVAALGVAWETNFLGIKNVIGPIVDRIVSGVQSLAAGIGYFIDDMQKNGIGDAILNIFGMGSNNESWLEGTLVSFGMVREAAEGFIGFIQNAWNIISPALSNIYNWFVSDALPAIGAIITDSIIPGIEAFITTVSNIWAEIAPGLLMIADWFLNSVLPGILDFITGTVVPGVQTFIDILVKVWNDVSPFLTNLANWFTNDALPLIINYIENVFVPGIQTFINILVGIWNLVSPVLTSLYDWFITNGLPFIESAIDTVTTVIESWVNMMAGVWDTISPALESVYKWFVEDALPVIQDTIENKVQPVVEGLFNFIGGVWDTVSSGLESLYNWFMVDGLEGIRGFIKDTVQPVIDGFINTLSTIWNTLKQPLEDLKTGMDGVFGWINDNVIKPFVDMIGGIGNTINDLLTSLGLVESKTQTAQGYMSGGNAADSAGNFMFGGARAGGGEVIGGGAYLVGEQGPELFVPGASGAIVPNGAGGGQQIRFEAGSVTIRANSEAEGRAAARGFGEELAMIMGEMG